MKYLRQCGVRTAGLIVLTSLAACASSIPTLSPYNVWVFNNFTAGNSATGGGLAVGGTATITSGYGIASNLGSEQLNSFPSGVTFVAGSVHGTPGLAQGNYYVGSGNVYNNGSGTQITRNPVDFSSQYTYFLALSAAISDLATTGTDNCTHGSGDITCTASAVNGLNVIDLSSASDLGNGLNIIGVSADSPLIINVGGTSGTLEPWSIEIDGAQINTADAPYLLFNFYDATSLKLESSLLGTILAPKADVTGNGSLAGQLIANSFDGSTAFSNLPYEGTVPNAGSAVPEPGGLLLSGLGLALLLGGRLLPR